MFDHSAALSAGLPLVRPIYPELEESAPGSWVEEKGKILLGGMARRFRVQQLLHDEFVAKVRDHEKRIQGTPLPALAGLARDLGKQLRRDGFKPALVAQAFALVSEASSLVMGMRHFDVQLLGGWVLLNGMIAEMETGEGKTLTATLPACTAALAGMPVHIITVNDYLVTRDAAIMTPLYRALGLTVGAVTETQAPPERQAAYRCDVTYATNKVIVFDYLRDRITLGTRSTELRMRMEKIAGKESRLQKLLLRGLSFAIVDEADSVLVDEARTPLIISAPSQESDEERVALQSIAIAAEMTRNDHFVILASERRAVLTEAGHDELDRRCADLGGVWTGLMRREELISQALSALHLFKRDEHYLVRDGKVQIIDEYTGRVMPDRSWQRGLHQLVEAKEGCKITARKEPLARISYQRFFRRYQRLGGMTGTASEVVGELGSIYGLAVVRVPTNKKSRRVINPERVYATEAGKWEAIAKRVQAVHTAGRPVLLGTRSVAASEMASEWLGKLGLEHQILNAKQDKEEAEIVARAGEARRVTIATNMAGRGTDIKLADDVAALGGLHVILSERHDSKRIDRQLEGRCARQGDPGSVDVMLSLEDSILSDAGESATSIVHLLSRHMNPGLANLTGSLAIRAAQRYAERLHSRVRKSLLKMDYRLSRTLSFTGRPE